jgi:hypothetical protein
MNNFYCIHCTIIYLYEYTYYVFITELDYYEMMAIMNDDDEKENNKFQFNLILGNNIEFNYSYYHKLSSSVFYSIYIFVSLYHLNFNAFLIVHFCKCSFLSNKGGNMRYFSVL